MSSSYYLMNRLNLFSISIITGRTPYIYGAHKEPPRLLKNNLRAHYNESQRQAPERGPSDRTGLMDPNLLKDLISYSFCIYVLFGIKYPYTRYTYKTKTPSIILNAIIYFGSKETSSYSFSLSLYI